MGKRKRTHTHTHKIFFLIMLLNFSTLCNSWLLNSIYDNRTLYCMIWLLKWHISCSHYLSKTSCRYGKKQNHVEEKKMTRFYCFVVLVNFENNQSFFFRSNKVIYCFFVLSSLIVFFFSFWFLKLWRLEISLGEFHYFYLVSNYEHDHSKRVERVFEITNELMNKILEEHFMLITFWFWYLYSFNCIMLGHEVAYFTSFISFFKKFY